VGLFAPLTDCFSCQTSLVKKNIYSCGILLAIWVTALFINILIVGFKKKYKIFDVSDGHAVYVQYGDVFSEEEIDDENKKRNIVIPVNRCFDTIVDDDLISSNTIHGKCMKQLYSAGIFTCDSLNECIQNNLMERNEPYELLERKDKRSGNLERYNIGTVSEVQVGIIKYFFLGLTTFDKDLHAHVSDEEYVLALMKMIIYNNKRSQRFPLIVPLIGAGAADMKKDEREILEYLVTLLKMNKGLINCDIHIVVRNTAKSRIPITNL
jgi:hypothetical protein